MIKILSDRISQKYQQLSAKQQTIANFILKQPQKAITLSSRELEKETGVSAATIVRFARQLGYKNLDEMRVYLAQQIEFNDHSVELKLSANEPTETLELKIIQLYRETLENIKETLDLSMVKKAGQILRSARYIFLFGVGTSGLVAYDLYHRLNRYGKTAFYETDTHMNLEFSLQSSKQDVLLAISYSGLTKEVILGAQSAQKRGTPVISILSNPDSPLAQATDIPLYIGQTEHLARLAAISSRIQSMIVTDILFAEIIKKQITSLHSSMVDSNDLTMKLKETDFDQRK